MEWTAPTLLFTGIAILIGVLFIRDWVKDHRARKVYG